VVEMPHSGSLSMFMILGNVSAPLVLSQPTILAEVSDCVQQAVAEVAAANGGGIDEDDIMVSPASSSSADSLSVFLTLHPRRVSIEALRLKLNHSTEQLAAAAVRMIIRVRPACLGRVAVIKVHIYTAEVTQWRCDGKVPTAIRVKPASQATSTGESLELATVIQVSQEVGGSDGSTFLKLADHRGWIEVGQDLHCEPYGWLPIPVTTTTNTPAPTTQISTSAPTTLAPMPVPTPPVIATMTVENVDFMQLKQKPRLLRQFTSAVQEGVAEVSGNGILPNDVRVTLSAGSVYVHAMLQPPVGVLVAYVCSNLEGPQQDSTDLSRCVSSNVANVVGISDVTIGRISISGVSVLVAAVTQPGSVPVASSGTGSIDLFVGVWMLALAAFFMMLLLLFAYKDHSIRQHAWSILGFAVSIFSAALVMRVSADFCLREGVAALSSATAAADANKGSSSSGSAILSTMTSRLLLSYLLLLGLFAALEVVTAALADSVCNALGEDTWVAADATYSNSCRNVIVLDHQIRRYSGRRSVARVRGKEIFVERRNLMMEDRLYRLRCYPTLLAHLCGFAAIDAGIALQRISPFMQSPLWSAVAVVAAQALLMGIFELSRLAKGRSFENAKQDVRRAVWEEACRVSEDDIAALSASFLVVQVLRFQFSGNPPSKHFPFERLDMQLSQSIAPVLQMYGCGIAFAAAAVLSSLLARKSSPSSSLRCRLCTIQKTMAMTFAWCMLWATHWEALRLDFLKHWDIQPGSVAWQLALSVVSSCLAFALLFTLDGIEDAAGHEESARSLTRSMTMALSLLMGISWECTLEESIRNLASLGQPQQATASSLFNNSLSRHIGPRPLAMQLAASLALVAMIVPAWRMHILRNAYHYSKLRSEVESTVSAVRQRSEASLSGLRRTWSECTVPRTSLQQTRILSPRWRGTQPQGSGKWAYSPLPLVDTQTGANDSAYGYLA